MGTENRKLVDNSISNGNGVTRTRIESAKEGKNSKEDTSIPSKVNAKDVPFLSLTVDENNVVEGAKEILRLIRSDWNLNSVNFKLFTDGITNKLVGCFRCINNENNSSISMNGSSNCDNTKGDVVLVRVYGNKTDLLIDRNVETRNIKLLHSFGFAPSLYATFKNGIVYEYVPGTPLSPETVTISKIWPLVAKKMAEMHKINVGCEKKREPMLWSKTQKFLNLIPDKFSDSEKHKRLEDTFLPVAKLREEFCNLYQQLEKLKSPLVFSHNDLLLGNVIYTENINQVTFIDYEYAEYNFQAFDIGNHFAEFAGIDEVDYTKYPSKEFQLKWLNIYLREYLEKDDITPQQVEKLYVQVNQFALAAHFFWAIWALIQAEHSTIDFDYIKFAHTRYSEYLTKKDIFLSMKFEEN